jgi:hypothetical protein
MPLSSAYPKSLPRPQSVGARCPVIPEVGADPMHYAAAQRVGKCLRDEGKWSVRYTSVRNPPGSCLGVTVPKAIDFAREQAQNLRLTWNGTRITGTEIISTLYL